MFNNLITNDMSTKDEGLTGSPNDSKPIVIRRFSEEDIDNCWAYYKSYLVDILNGDYDLETAREDLGGLIGSEYDKRSENGV